MSIPGKGQDASGMPRGQGRKLPQAGEPLPASPAAVSATPTPDHWLAWLCLSRLLLSLIFTAYAGVLPLVREAWGMSAAKAATVQSAWQLCYLVSLFSVGMLADRYGARRTYVVASLFAAGAACAFALFSQGYLSALLLYGLAGLCSGGSYTPGLALVYQLTATETRGRAMGWFLAASSLGYAVALGGQALLSVLSSWRLGLLFAAGAAVLGAGFGWIALRGVRDVASKAPQGDTPWQGITETLKDPAAMTCNWAYTCHCWELLALWAWLPSYLAAAGQGVLRQAGGSWGIGLAGLAHLLGAGGSIIGGTASDRLGRPQVMLLFTGLSLAGSFLLGWLWTWPFWLLALAASCYNVCAIADSSVYSTALAETVPTARLGAAYSVRSVLGFGAGAISPVVFGAVLDVGQGAFPAPSPVAWVLAWSSAGVGAILGPLMIRRFAQFAPNRRPAPRGRGED